MSRTRFMVIRLKELIKTAVFAVIGAAIIIAVIVMIVPKDDDGEYKSGTYTSAVSIGSQSAAVTLTFSENEITDMDFVPDSESFSALYPLALTAADEIRAQIIENQSTDNIELSFDGSAAGEIIIDGANSCIARAKR